MLFVTCHHFLDMNNIVKPITKTKHLFPKNVFFRFGEVQVFNSLKPIAKTNNRRSLKCFLSGLIWFFKIASTLYDIPLLVVEDLHSRDLTNFLMRASKIFQKSRRS